MRPPPRGLTVTSRSLDTMLHDIFLVAMRSLGANKMRSFLTMLGIIIGVASVITMLAVGAGAQTRVAEQIRSLGANVLMIVPGAAIEAGVRQASGSRHTLTESDAVAIASQIPEIVAASPSIRGSAQIVNGARNWNTTVNGTTSDNFVIREWLLHSGRFFSSSDETGAGKVALLGLTVAKNLFGSDNPVGQQIRIASVPFEVIGVLAEKGQSGAGVDQDDIIFVPIATAKLRLMGSANQVNREAVAYIIAKAVSDEVMPVAKLKIELLLRQRHRIAPGRPDDFRVSDPAAAMAVQNASTTTIAWLLAAIASVSLVVGGISIMNIMLVSAAERTREIGIRLALGARRSHIRNQFLAEAVVLCFLGGGVGVLLGSLAAVATANLAGWPIFLGGEAIFGALLFAGGIGVFFGLYPALKASQLDPVEALRSE